MTDHHIPVTITNDNEALEKAPPFKPPTVQPPSRPPERYSSSHRGLGIVIDILMTLGAQSSASLKAGNADPKG